MNIYEITASRATKTITKNVAPNPNGGAWGFPERLPEANIQAEFYHLCRLNGIPCILEFHTPTGRHDVTVWTPGYTHLLCIVECKSLKAGQVFYSDSRQIRRYQQVGVPVYGIPRLEEAEAVFQTVKEKHFGTTATASSGVEREALPYVVPLEKRPRRRRIRKSFSHMDLDENIIFRA